MNIRRALLAFLAVMMSGLAFAQTSLPPFLSGVEEQWRQSIFHMGMLRLSRNETVTATAGGTLANSVVLNRAINIVTTVATTNDSVTLPALTGSVQLTIVNNGANTMRVFPDASTSQIDTAGAGTAKTLAANKMMIVTKGADGLWYSVTSP